MRPPILLLVAFLGCTPEVSPPDATVEPDSSEAEEDASVEPDAVVDSGMLPPGPGLAGVLRDEAGAILPSRMVLACMATTCFFGASESDGTFYFGIEPPADIALKTLADLNATPRRAAALRPVKLVDQTLVEVGAFYVPNLPAGVLFGPASADPQTLSAGDGLELTLNRADMRARIGEALVDLAARAIPQDRYPPLDLGTEEVIAVYALHPSAATSSSPIGIRAPTTLTAGTPVFFRSISEIDGHLAAPATGMSDGAFVATTPGQGILELTWLVISR